MAATGQLVLVVDDDDSMREAIARLLDVAGFARATYVTAEGMLADHGRHPAACVV